MGCLGFHTEEHGICRQARSLVTMTDADDGDRDTALLTLTCKREHHHGDPRGQRHEAEQEGNPPLEGSELSDVLQDLVIVQARLLPHAALAQDKGRAKNKSILQFCLAFSHYWVYLSSVKRFEAIKCGGIQR